MSKPQPSTRVCPMCHCLLWEEDFLQPADLETWKDSLSDDEGPEDDALDELVDRAVDALLDGRVVVHVHLVSGGD